MSKQKAIPAFASEDEEREFWATHDATDFVDFHGARPAAFPNVRPSTRTISLRLPESLLESIKVAAHKRDVPYQAFIKMILADAINREQGGVGSAP